METITIGQLVERTGGRLIPAALPTGEPSARTIKRIVVDCQAVRTGDVFWELTRDRADGNASREAYARGAAGVVSSLAAVAPRSGRWKLIVPDTELALRRMAEAQREKYRGKLIAVTGSVGKSTTRQLITSTLQHIGGNTIGLENCEDEVNASLSLLCLGSHDYALCELVAAASAETSQLTALCRPEIGVVTRIGDTPGEGAHGREETALARHELLEALPDDGWAVLNGDDRWQHRFAERCRAKIVWVGRGADCKVLATEVESRAGKLNFRIERARFSVPLWGRHHLTAALSAVAIGQIAGHSLETIAGALAEFQPPPKPCVITTLRGATVIHDRFNSSPAAMRAALELLRDYQAPGRRIVLCGDMGELGDAAGLWHRRLGDEVVTLCGADALVACGEHAEEVVSGARAAGMPVRTTVACRRPEDTLTHLHEWLAPGNVILVKGSRKQALEQLIEQLNTGGSQAA